MNSYDKLKRIASLIGDIEAVIEKQIDRRNIGAVIASEVFDIALEKHRNIAYDGRFRSGEHKDKSVHVKWYGSREPTLDIDGGNTPYFYLVLTGSENEFVTEEVYLFDVVALITKLRVRNTETGLVDPTTMINEDWGLKPKNWHRGVTPRQIEYIERLLKKNEFDFEEAITCAKADEYYLEDKVRQVTHMTRIGARQLITWLAEDYEDEVS